MKLAFKFTVLLVVATLAGVLSTSSAQELFLAKKIGNFGNVPQVGDPVSATAEFKLKTGERAGVLNVNVSIDHGWHIFSMNNTHGPVPTKISVAESGDYRLLGSFTPSHEPEVKIEEGFDEPCEEYEGEVTWSAPIKLADGVAEKDLAVQVVLNCQTCESRPGGSCRQVSLDLKGGFGGFDDTLVVANDVQLADVEIEEYKPRGVHATIKARLVRASGTDLPIGPGEMVNLEITATPSTNFHIYSYSLKETQYMSTLVGFTETSGLSVKGPELSEEPEEGIAFGSPAFYHHHPITWTFPIEIPKSAKNGQSYPFSGVVGFQVCDDSSCDRPTGIAFDTEITVGEAAVVPVNWTPSSYAKVAKAPKAPIEPSDNPAANGGDATAGAVGDDDTSHIQIADTPEQLKEMLGYYDAEAKINYVTLNNAAKTTLWTAIFGAFVGGMLLNLMPCVFPVLGLKVMGFVQQAGSEPKKIRNHGIAFTAGLVVSMWVLAGFILFLKLSLGKSVNWGQQMGNPYFVCGIIVLLFLLGLNMAGVFEIGTSLTTVGGKASRKKGYTGSFFSGILTTLIATPCSGPFLGAAMGYTLAQPPVMAMVLFTIFALGIAIPYLVLSFFPKMISKLPKPGPWMETFKVTMGFALFATVAFFARTFGSQTGIRGLSWLIMALVVIGLAAYVYGQWGLSDVKAGRRWLIGYGLAGLIAILGGYMCYDAASQEGELVSHGEWERWEPGKVEYSLAKQKPIIWVDYTADW